MTGEANSKMYDDIVQILYRTYDKLLRVNLTDDTHEDIKLEEDDNHWKDNEKISQWFSECAKTELIHKDDKASFKAFVNVDNIKNLLAGGREFISYKYRKLVNGQYRWVSLDIYRSDAYSEDNQVAILGVKDMNKEYLDRLDTSVLMDESTICAYRINITYDNCVRTSGSLLAKEENLPTEGTIGFFTENMMKHLSGEEERQEYRSIFNRDKLLEIFSGGDLHASMEYAYICNDGRRLYLRTMVEMLEDIDTGNVKAVLYVRDITEEYVNKTLPKLLYEHEYETVAIIDTVDGKISFRKMNDSTYSYTKGKIFDYQESVIDKVPAVIAESDRNTYRNKASLDRIISGLKNKEMYSFTIHHVDKKGDKWLKKYKYIYMDKHERIILVTVEDVTNITEHDVLTGGINRRGFLREAGNFLKESQSTAGYSLLFFDIKGIKAINELLGTKGGDEVLRFVYAHIKNSFLKPVVLSRTTADHYACLTETENIDYSRLTSLCQCRYSYKGKLLELYIRCGIYNITDDTMDIVSILDHAKIAKENIHDEYTNPYMVFDTTMKDRYIDKSELIYELKDALDNGEFKVYYQPIYDPHTGKLASAEALIRWAHPEKGMISPGVFIPALEESGHISQVDLFVQRTVRKFVENRHNQGKKNIPISVNLSWMDFYDKQMMDSIIDDVKMAQDNSKYMRFEVTETSYAALVENHGGHIHRLRDVGAKILLDDFGSGFSSFSTIRDYDFDIIKLDMGFVQQIKNNDKVNSIIHSIIDMAHHVNAKVVAEGAETDAQVDFLRRHGCDYIQGYYFSRPLPQEDFEKLLEEAEI